MSYNNTQQYFLGDLYDISSGLSKSKDQFGSGYPFLSFKTVFNHTIIPTDLKDLAQTTLSEQNKYSILYGDVFLTRTSETANELGMSSVALKDYPQATFNGFTKRLRPKKGVMEFIDPKFIAYYLRSKDFRNQIDSISVLTTRASLNQGMIEKLTITVPNIKTQKKIAAILSALDEKIAINRAINENLEQQAMALYRQMFVETNNDARRECRADEYFDISIGKTPPRKEAQWFSMNPIDCIWVSISDMGRCGMYIADSSEYLTHESVDKFNIKVVPDNTVLLSFKLTVGRVAITDGAMATNEAIAHFKTDKPEINEYLYCYLKDFNYQTMGSTSSIATAVNSKIIKAMPFVAPTDAELVTFHSATAPMFEMIKTRQRENTRLAELRDSLLPKLMSGEIDVSAVQL